MEFVLLHTVLIIHYTDSLVPKTKNTWTCFSNWYISIVRHIQLKDDRTRLQRLRVLFLSTAGPLAVNIYKDMCVYVEEHLINKVKTKNPNEWIFRLDYPPHILFTHVCVCECVLWAASARVHTFKIGNYLPDKGH